ncbi:hypothetical protein S83_066018 [Arachis hypogaea]
MPFQPFHPLKKNVPKLTRRKSKRSTGAYKVASRLARATPPPPPNRCPWPPEPPTALCCGRYSLRFLTLFLQLRSLCQTQQSEQESTPNRGFCSECNCSA